MRARVEIMLKDGVLDPQGAAIGSALGALGFNGFGDIRQGKLIEIELSEHDPEMAERQVHEMCEKLLVNTVIERYRVKLLP